MYLTSMTQPTAADVFDKAGIDFFWGATPLSPIQDKFPSHRVGKFCINACLLENFEGILIRPPVFTKWWWGTDLKCRGKPLLRPPACEGMLPKLGVDISAAL